MLAMVTLGFGELLGAIVMARWVDKFGSKNCALINIFNIALASVIASIFVYRDTYDWLAFIMTLAWGY